ncbi:uncharacterized protein [Aristolochia californica]|uniref:uncharacterized protein isoform X2 n=1 Tax=Aristolochia californica TaxID=171875 RepID=UPI0035E38548
MDALLHTAVPPRFFLSNKLPLKLRLVRCSRENENGTGFPPDPSPVKLGEHNMDMLQESSESANSDKPDLSSNDIWKLFNDAQRNIMYLNKQRLSAIKELNKSRNENQLLLSRIEELEAKMRSNGVKGLAFKSDSLSTYSELLLRIDSMVLLDLIRIEEASDLRRFILDSKVSILDAFSDIQHKKDTDLLIELRQFSERSRGNGLHIVHICTEMAPVTSNGSLASYVTGLSSALQRKGNLVEVILPKYSFLSLDEVWGLRRIEAKVHSFFSGQWHENRIWTGLVKGIGVTFIEPLYYSAFFNRDRMYGYSDDFERFTYFSRASLDYLVKLGKQPDVLHVHNWDTAIIGPLFWDIFVNQGLGDTRILFTCQGFHSQCLEKPEKLALCGLDPHRLHRPDRLQDNSRPHLVNILKGGVVYANKVVIVSTIHSKDRIIRTLSHGLESTLASHKEKLVIAPYGFDDTIWDPSTDKLLPSNYSVDDFKGKAVCKATLRQRLGFQRQDSMPVVGCMFSALSDVDLKNLKAAVWVALKKDAQIVFIQPSQTPNENSPFLSLEEEFQNVRFINKHDKALQHLVFAGSDIILCPSFHDPVQQVPLKAIKYGTAPIAITYRYPEDQDFGGTNVSVYIIRNYAPMSLSQALDQIKNDPHGWNRRIKEGMTKDFSWNTECSDVHLAAYFSVKNL